LFWGTFLKPYLAKVFPSDAAPFFENFIQTHKYPLLQKDLSGLILNLQERRWLACNSPFFNISIGLQPSNLGAK
jgi:hypothetical protein